MCMVFARVYRYQRGAEREGRSRGARPGGRGKASEVRRIRVCGLARLSARYSGYSMGWGPASIPATPAPSPPAHLHPPGHHPVNTHGRPVQTRLPTCLHAEPKLRTARATGTTAGLQRHCVLSSLFACHAAALCNPYCHHHPCTVPTGSGTGN